MRIVSFSLGHAAFDPRVMKTAKWLQQRNHEVILVANDEQFQTFGTRRLVDHGTIDGIPYKILCGPYAIFCRKEILALKPDAIHFHEVTPPWMFFARWLRGEQQQIAEGKPAQQVGQRFWPGPKHIKYVYDVHEYEAERRAPGVSDEHKANRGWLERQIVPFMDHCISVSPMLCDRLTQDHGKPFLCLPNVTPTPTRELYAHALRQVVPTQKPIAMFCGNLTAARQLPKMCKAANLIGAQAVLLGRTFPNDSKIPECLELGAKVLPQAPYPYFGGDLTMLDLLAGAQVGFNDTESEYFSYQVALPNKTFEYAWAGVPCVSSAHMRQCTEIQDRYGTGLTYDGTVEDLAAKFKQLIESPPPPENFMRFAADWHFAATAGKVLDGIYGIGAAI